MRQTIGNENLNFGASKCGLPSGLQKFRISLVTGFSCLSWNVHRARGNDGVVDPDRTLRTLMDEVWREGTEALLLQEADEEIPPYGGIFDIKRIENLTGLRSVHTSPTLRYSESSGGFLGAIVFLHPSITVEDVRLLDLPGQCPRGAVIVDASRKGAAFRLIVTHLSLSQALRIVQLRTIGQHLQRSELSSEPRQTVLAGDLNEWRPWGGFALSPRVLGATYKGPARASFPIRRPFLPLDRVLATAPAEVENVEVLDGPAIRMTSDHRPIWAHVKLGSSGV